MSAGTPSPPGLRLRAGVADRGFDLELEVAAGECLAVLGPNGAGKSTLLSVIAGWLRPDHGRGMIGDRAIFDLDTGLWLPPHRREVGLLAQAALLFPHLTVAENVAFGPRSAGAGRTEAAARARHWLSEVDAVEFAGRRPGELSGGQAQRVAIARALAAEPRVLLLDEPLSALDVDIAVGIRQLLRRVLAERTVVIVTHDVLDALLLADRVLVLESGRIAESGPTAEVLARPRSRFGARFAGLNLLSGVRAGDHLRAPDDTVIIGHVIDEERLGTGAAVAVFSPSAVVVSTDRPVGVSTRNAFEAMITELEPLGERIRVHTDRFAADVTAAAVAELGLAPGRPVVLSVKASEVEIYAA